MSLVTPLPRVEREALPARDVPRSYGRPAQPANPLREFVTMLRRHARIALLMAALVWAAGLYYVQRQTPLFRATSTVRLTDARAELTGSIGAAYASQQIGMYTDPMLSEIQVLRSSKVARGAVERSGARLRSATPGFSVAALNDVRVAESAPEQALSLEFRPQTVLARSGTIIVERPYAVPLEINGVGFVVPRRPDDVDAVDLTVVSTKEAIGRVMGGLDATSRQSTDVIDIHIMESDPGAAQRVADAVALAYQESNARSAQEQSRRRRVFLEGQLASVDSVLTASQQALSGFRSREKLYSSRERFAAEQVDLAASESRRADLLANERALRELLGQLQRGPEAAAVAVLPGGAVTDPVVVDLYTQLGAQRARRDSLTTGAWARSATDPDVQRFNTMMSATSARLTDAVRQRLSAASATLATLDQRRARSSAELRDLPNTETEEVRLVQQVESARGLVSQLREQYEKARLEEAVEMGQVSVLEEASLPLAPVGSGRARKMLFVMMIGLVAGSGCAYLSERLNTTLNGRSEMEELLRLPVLALIPPLLPRRRGESAGNVERSGVLATVTSPDEPGAEAFRMLRTSLLFSQADASTRILAITSSVPSEGKSTVSANVAVTFAQHGLKVLLIDCDFRRAQQHLIFGFDQRPGLSELVLGFAATAEVVRPGPVENLYVIPAGTAPPNPSELATSGKLRSLVRELAQEYDLVVLDTPPVAITAEATVLSMMADAVALVGRIGRTDRGLALSVISRLRELGAPVVGGVLNDPDGRSGLGGGYYGGYGGYGAYGYTQGTEKRSLWRRLRR
jgi:tyrosine-protein kinase Etk/Wzc